MSKTNETCADIIAEMRENRGFSVPFTQDGVKAVWRADLVDYADRIEAAAKRDAAIHAMTCEANERLREHLEIALKDSARRLAPPRLSGNIPRRVAPTVVPKNRGGLV